MQNSDAEHVVPSPSDEGTDPPQAPTYQTRSGVCFSLGMSSAVLVDLIGYPGAVERRVLKSKIQWIWKYDASQDLEEGLHFTMESERIVRIQRSRPSP